MDKKIMTAIAGAVLAAAGGGFYYAWQEGMVPASVVRPHPRAPLPENFVATLQNSSAVAQSLKPACLRVNLYVNREIDRMGRAGLQHQRVPGWDVITIAQVPGDGGQRVGNITQALTALAKAGIYDVKDTETEDADGNKLPAKAFSLTLAGWQQFMDDQCIKAGTPRITEVTEFSRVMPDKDGKRVYDVKAKYVVQDIAAWADDPALQTMVSPDQIKKLREPVTVSFRLERTDSGWQLQKPDNAVPDLTREMVMDLVSKWRSSATPQACIRLPSTSPGIEVALAPYALTLFDSDVRGAVDARFLAQLAWQSRIAQLVKAGLFSSEKVAANPKLNMPAGMRYALDPAYQTWLDMNDARCLRLGDSTLEILNVTVMQQQQQREGSEQRSASAVAKMMLRLSKDAWINKVNVALPEVEAIKDAGGVPVLARLSWNDRDKEKEWRLTYLQAPQSEPAPPRMPRSVMNAAIAGIAAMPGGTAIAVPAPAPAAPQLASGDIVWQGGSTSVNGRVSADGLTVTYCCAGASSATQASSGVTSGKVYAEFSFTARPRALKGDTWTTIGVLPAPDARSGGGLPHVMPGTPTMAFKRGDEIEHSDVIGIAIDMDAGMVYFSRNGKWLNAQPGGGGGTPLDRGKQYRVTAVLSASSSSSGTDSWTANFGKSKFRFAMPRGYKSYDGRQRG